MKAISAAVKKSSPQALVFMDGGVRRGTDVLKALALGADLVFLGRPIAWALNYNGKDGVKEALELINEELKTGMILTHSTELKEVTEQQVIHKYRPRL